MFLINEDITYSPQFSYREYEVIKQNNFRYYKIADKLVPSVTSILRLSRHNQKDTFSAKQACFAENVSFWLCLDNLRMEVTLGTNLSAIL